MSLSIQNLAETLKPGQSEYNVPDVMPARVVTKDTLGSLSLIPMNVPVPKIGADEALIAIKAAGINFNTIWTAYGKPVNTFDFLKRLKLSSNPAAIHNQDYHIPGSDASGFIVKLGTEDTRWNVGDSVVANCNWHRNEDVEIYNDAMISSEQKIWGYETNYGSLAAFSVVKLHQLMPKPQHLGWVESASYSLVFCTAYRMLMSDNGLRIKAGDNVLIWGGAGGLGMSAIQLCQLVGANPIAVVSDDAKGEFLRDKLGMKDYINRKTEGLDFWKDGEHNPLAWRKLQSILKKRFGGPVDVVFEHPGRDTMAASIYVLRKGGKIVTCAATSGYDISYDHRYLWMDSKSIIGCHFANPYEAKKANDLVVFGRIKPFVSSVYSFDKTDNALEQFVKNGGYGKVVVTVLADQSESGVSSHNLFEVEGE